MAKILIIDDDTEICMMLSKKIQSINHEVEVSNTLLSGLDKVRNNSFDIVLLDVQLPDGNGLSAIEEIRETSSTPEVIIITGFGDPDGAELAIKNGAWDYVEKPFSIVQVILPLTRALEYRKEKYSGKAPVVLKLDGIIGNDSKMKACYNQIAQAAVSRANVLINGETGTGKELVAKSIHQNSSRANNNFVVIDCASLPETLIESEILGHDKGAFTGADKTKKGLVEQAHKGTLFLDEIGELPTSLQKVFLRVLQERRFRPIGSSREVESDFRLVAATNRNLKAMTNEGKFRQDLLFRLQTITIKLPPLREHKGDIKDLMMHFLTEICESNGLETKGYSPDFLNILMSYNWPGNVRELINTMEQSVIAAMTEPTLFPMHLPIDVRVTVARGKSKEDSTGGKGIIREFQRLKEYRESVYADIEKKYFVDLIVFSNGNRKDMCRISGISRTNLYHLLNKYNLS